LWRTMSGKGKYTPSWERPAKGRGRDFVKSPSEFYPKKKAQEKNDEGGEGRNRNTVEIGREKRLGARLTY